MMVKICFFVSHYFYCFTCFFYPGHVMSDNTSGEMVLLNLSILIYTAGFALLKKIDFSRG